MTPRALCLLTCLAFAIAAPGASASAAGMKNPPQPAAVVAALYAEEQAGRAPLTESGERAAKLTQRLAALWAQAEAASRQRGDEEGPVDFDVVTNSQGATIKSFALKTERPDATHATVVATLVPDNWVRASPRENVLRYDLAFDGVSWAIDDIRGVAGPRPWSLRVLLTRALKEP